MRQMHWILSAALSLTISAAQGQQGRFATGSAPEIGVAPAPGAPALLPGQAPLL